MTTVPNTLKPPSRPDVTFVCVSDRPDCLRGLIACLRLQTSSAWELIVLDQTPRAECMLPVKEVEALGETRVFWYAVPRIGDLGVFVKMVAVREIARGEYLCLPNDDAYYVPVFVDHMILYARTQDLGLAYCDWLFDRADNTVPYRHMHARPFVGHVDIGGFIVRRSVLLEDGWPHRGEGSDGALVERLASRTSHGCIPGQQVLYVKN